MRQAVFVLMLFIGIGYSYAEGMQEAVNESMKTQEPYATTMRMAEGTELGQKLFIEVISKMEKNGETNYDIEYIVNKYVDYIVPFVYLQSYDSIYDWMDFIRGNNILIFSYAFDTFLKLMDMYISSKEDFEDEDEEDDAW